MPSYPATCITTPDGDVNILQITDLHLSAHKALLDDSISDVVTTCRDSFEQVLKQALSENRRCDLILVTGDLVSDVQTSTYDYIFAVLEATHLPFACIPGNHDVTDEADKHLPFFARTLVARAKDKRLLSQHVIEMDHWRVLLVDSSIPGQVAGEVKSTDIDWLCEQLEGNDKPTIIALHHHLLPMRSAWIDAHMAQNPKCFWQRLASYPQLKAIINGHTHQEQTCHYEHIKVYTTPSTCYQYKPLEDDFSYDIQARPGYRWLQLANNGQLASWVKRLDT